MKRCPTCTRTFLDEQLSYCTDDGTRLVDQQQSSSFDPQATVLDSPKVATNDISSPAPTRPFRADEMPGGWSTPHSWADPPAAPVVTPPSWSSTPTPPPSAWTPPPAPRVGYAARKPQQNPVAIASLAAGVFSLTIGLCCYVGIGTGPIAIILGVVALVQLKNSPALPASKGMAIGGIATGVVSMILLVLFFILNITFRSWG